MRDMQSVRGTDPESHRATRYIDHFNLSQPKITEKVRPPRALLVDFPLGHPMGNPFEDALQKRILTEALKYLKEISEPGTIVDNTETCRIKRGKCTVCELE